jgi:hypothetical protein
MAVQNPMAQWDDCVQICDIPDFLPAPIEGPGRRTPNFFAFYMLLPGALQKRLWVSFLWEGS